MCPNIYGLNYSEMGTTRHSKDKVIQPEYITFCINSNNHEFKILSWWAVQSSGTRNRTMVDEEAGHRYVWGLTPNSGKVKVGRYTYWLETKDMVVGLSEQSTIMLLLYIRIRNGTEAMMDELTHTAKTEYERYFNVSGLNIYYTRKFYENVQWELFGAMPYRKLATVSLPGGMETDILEDVRRFYGERDIYNRLGRPYKRVYCLHGPPGTGKTSIVSAIASELRKPLAIFNVDSLRDDTFIELISRLPKGAVMLFEDVDALFKTRHNEDGHRARNATSSNGARNATSSTGGMTFSTLLNTLDGILHPNGTLIFMTTNHLDMLDSALHRPGRVDRLIHVGLSSVDQRIALWNSMFPKVEPPPILTKENLQISPASLSAILFELRHETSIESIYRKITDAINQATSAHSNKHDEQRLDALKRKSVVKKRVIK